MQNANRTASDDAGARRRRPWRLAAPLVAAAILSAGTASPAVAAPGDLDPAFGGGAVAVAPGPGGRAMSITDVVAVPGGPIALERDLGGSNPWVLPLGGAHVAGQFQSTPWGGRLFSPATLDPFSDVRLSAFTSAGALQLRFGAGGSATFDAGPWDTPVAASLAGGRLFVAGHSDRLTPTPNHLWARTPFVARQLPDGSLDTSYGAAGISSLPYDVYEVVDMAVSSAGEVTLAYRTATFDSFLVRLDRNGVVDPTFGVGGRVVMAGTSVAGIAVDGAAHTVVLSSSRLYRFTSSGTPDPSFGNGTGHVAHFTLCTTPLGTMIRACDMAVDSSGRITVAAATQLGTTVKRFESTGAVDSTFGQGPFHTVELAAFAASDIESDAQGRLLIAGTEAVPMLANTALRVARLDPAGSLDTTFGNGGVAQPGLQTAFSPRLATDGTELYVSGLETLGAAPGLRTYLAKIQN